MTEKTLQLTPEGILVPYKYGDGALLVKTPDPRRPVKQQIFTFINARDAVQYHFDIDKLTRMIDERTVVCRKHMIRFRLHDIRHIVDNNGIEAEHLDRLTRADLERPGILVEMPEASQVIVDGNHRAVARWKLGLREMLFWRVRLEQTRPCLLALPDEVGFLEVNRGKL